MSCQRQFAGGLLGRVFSFLEEYSRKKQFPLLPRALSGPVAASLHSRDPSTLPSSRPPRWGWSSGSRVPRRALSSPVSTCPVSGGRKYLSCFGATERWLEPGAVGSPAAGWSSRRVSFLFFRVRISSWPLRAWRKPHLSPTRVHWVYIFIRLRTRLGYTFFLRWTLSPTLNKTKCIFTCL